MTDALATVIPALTDKDVSGAPEPGDLRTALRSYILLPPGKRPGPAPQFAKIGEWLESACRPATDLSQAKIVLSALDALALKMDGATAKPNTINRKRAVFHSVLQYAVATGELDSNPLHKVQWTPSKTSQTVDPRVVVNQLQALNLLTAVTYIGARGRGQRLMAMFACMYYAAMRGRPYDLRHAAVSLWLNGGVSPTEIAERPGHSVEVLLRVYAKCVHGQKEIANRRIEEILGPSPFTDEDEQQAA